MARATRFVWVSEDHSTVLNFRPIESQINRNERKIKTEQRAEEMKAEAFVVMVTVYGRMEE